MKTIKIIAKNSTHNTEASIRINGRHGGTISPERANRLRKELCVKGCNCFATRTQFFEHIPGYRNSENQQIKMAAQYKSDGGIFLEII